jgi:hypothetical protein
MSWRFGFNFSEQISDNLFLESGFHFLKVGYKEPFVWQEIVSPKTSKKKTQSHHPALRFIYHNIIFALFFHHFECPD